MGGGRRGGTYARTAVPTWNRSSLGSRSIFPLRWVGQDGPAAGRLYLMSNPWTDFLGHAKDSGMEDSVKCRRPKSRLNLGREHQTEGSRQRTIDAWRSKPRRRA